MCVCVSLNVLRRNAKIVGLIICLYIYIYLYVYICITSEYTKHQNIDKDRIVAWIGLLFLSYVSVTLLGAHSRYDDTTTSKLITTKLTSSVQSLYFALLLV